MASDSLDVSYNSRIVGLGGYGVMDGVSASGACSMLTRVNFRMFLFSRVLGVRKEMEPVLMKLNDLVSLSGWEKFSILSLVIYVQT